MKGLFSRRPEYSIACNLQELNSHSIETPTIHSEMVPQEYLSFRTVSNEVDDSPTFVLSRPYKIRPDGGHKM